MEWLVAPNITPDPETGIGTWSREAFRRAMDYYAHAPQTGATLERLAREQPKVLACMHGSAWRGDGAGLLRALAKNLSARQLATAA